MHFIHMASFAEEKTLLPPLEVVDQLAASPHITLGQVRDYLLRVVSAHSATLTAETSRTEQYSCDTAKMRETIDGIRTRCVSQFV